MWHVNNEYACHVPECYCDQCASVFRTWLKNRYGTLDVLNDVWSTYFWSQRYENWNDIFPPRLTPAQPNPSQVLDYRRFMNDSLLQCFLTEKQILASLTPTVPITTNFMVDFKPLDYFSWALHLSLVAIDIYPPPFSPPWLTAITYDLMRSLKRAPFVVMEQSPSQVNWRPQNPHKRPGNIRLQSLQSIARGSDGVMYFQFRQSRGGAEKFHSAIVSHEGSENTRIFNQVAQIGAELEKLSIVDGSNVECEVAIVIDWENWWGVEYLPGPSDRLKYTEQISHWYRSLYALNIPVDFVQPESDLSGYRLVFAPLLYMLRPNVAKNLESFVENGGVLLVTFFSGIVDQHDRVTLGGYPGSLRKLLGIYVEEFDPFSSEMSNTIHIPHGQLKGTYPCTLWGELIHLEHAHAIGTFTNDYYADGPVLTRNKFGKGSAYYIATQSEELTEKLTKMICEEAGVQELIKVSRGVEVTMRVKDGIKVYFLLNHNEEKVQVKLPEGVFRELLGGGRVSKGVEVEGIDVVVLQAIRD